MSWDDVVELALEVPAVSVGTALGTPAPCVRKGFMSRLREDGETPAIRCDAEDRPFLIEDYPGFLHDTPHHRDRPMVLVALRHADEELLRQLVEAARAERAPRTLVRAGRAKSGLVE